jgi:hypothetical protein
VRSAHWCDSLGDGAKKKDIDRFHGGAADEATNQVVRKYFVPPEETATGLSPIDQNHASVVNHIETGNDIVLLDADLERTNSPLTGWNAVVASTIRPQQPAGGFKIPHHGKAQITECGRCGIPKHIVVSRDP